MRKSHIILLVVLFFSILTAIGAILVGLGRSYGSNFLMITSEPTPISYTSVKKRSVKKIQVKKSNQAGCFEVSLDGAIRVYENCDGELTEAHRFSDPKYILRLFKLASEEDLSKYTNPSDGAQYELTIETDEGTFTIYIPAGGGDDIIETIDNIEEEIPQPSKIPTIGPSPTGSPLITPSVTPVTTGFVPPTPTVGPIPTGALHGFTCDFSDTGGPKKPYSISNTICSSGPTPLP